MDQFDHTSMARWSAEEIFDGLGGESSETFLLALPRSRWSLWVRPFLALRVLVSREIQTTILALADHSPPRREVLEIVCFQGTGKNRLGEL